MKKSKRNYRNLKKQYVVSSHLLEFKLFLLTAFLRDNKLKNLKLLHTQSMKFINLRFFASESNFGKRIRTSWLSTIFSNKSERICCYIFSASNYFLKELIIFIVISRIIILLILSNNTCHRFKCTIQLPNYQSRI